MKKTSAALLFALAAGLTLSTAVLAEPFNNRDPDFLARVQPQTDVLCQAVVATSSHFDDEGEDYLVTAPASSDKTTREGMIPQTGFNHHTQGWNILSTPMLLYILLGIISQTLLLAVALRGRNFWSEPVYHYPMQSLFQWNKDCAP